MNQGGYDRSAASALDGINASPIPAPDSLAAWIWDGSTAARFEPTMGTVTGLIQTGDVRLIDDQGLREGVMRYQQAAQALENTGSRYQEYRLRALEQLGLVISLDGLPAPYSPLRPRVPPDWGAAVEDPVFHSAVFNLRVSSEFRARLLIGFQERVEELRESLNRAMLARGLETAAS